MSTKKLQIVTPIVTSVNDKTGDVTLEQSDITGLVDTLSNKVDKKTPKNVNNVALLDSNGNLVDSGKQLTPEGIGAESLISRGAYSGDLNNVGNTDGTLYDNSVVWFSTSNGTTSAPEDGSGFCITWCADGGYHQEIQYSNGTIYRRLYYNGGWHEWIKVLNESDASEFDPKGAGIYAGFTDIPANSDLNDYTICGYYRQGSSGTGSTISNCPAQGAFILIVSNALGYNESGDITGKTWRYRSQRFILLGGNEYTRCMYTNGDGTIIYGDWKTVLNDTNGKAVDAAKADGITAYNNSSKVIKIGYSSKELISNPSRVATYDSSGNIGNTSWGSAATALSPYLMFIGSESDAALRLSDTVINMACSGSTIKFGKWTPTIVDATVSSYAVQQGWYLKIGNIVVVGWYMYVKFASGQTSNGYKITGLPYTPSVRASGGGVCSGYYSANQVNFSGWLAVTDGIIYAYGVTSQAADNKWAQENIFCGTGESYTSGTIIYTTSLGSD